MLPDTRHDDCVVGRVIAQLLHHVLRLERVTARGLVIAQRVLLLPARDRRLPDRPVRHGIGDVGAVGRPQRCDQRLHGHPGVTGNGDVGHAHLAVFGWVDIDVDDLGTGGEVCWVSRDPVVKARPEIDEQVGLLHRGHRRVVAVHAGHAQAETMTVWEHSAGHQGRDDMDVAHLCELTQRLRRTCLQQAPARVDHWALSGTDQRGGFGDGRGIDFVSGPVAGQVNAVWPVPGHHLVADVLGQVDQHRSRPARGGDVKRLGDDARDVRPPR